MHKKFKIILIITAVCCLVASCSRGGNGIDQKITAEPQQIKKSSPPQMKAFVSNQANHK